MKIACGLSDTLLKRAAAQLSAGDYKLTTIMGDRGKPRNVTGKYYLTHWLVKPPPVTSLVLPAKKLSQPVRTEPPASAIPAVLPRN